MNTKISFFKYRYYISRKIPCIIYYENKKNPSNNEVISIMDKMCDKYKLIFCYKFDWKKFFKLNLKIVDLHSSDILCFKEKTILKKISVYNTLELDNLFQTVYNDCVINCLCSYNRILINENRIKLGHKHDTFDLYSPSYDIHRKNNECINSKNQNNSVNDECLLKKLPYCPKQTRNMKSKIYKTKKEIYGNDGNTLIPVKKGLPKIDIFFIPLNKVGTNQYFEI